MIESLALVFESILGSSLLVTFTVTSSEARSGRSWAALRRI
jgi:hypothetical protein